MKKVALMFSGQGSQYVGMAKSLYDDYSIAKETFEEANDTLGFDLAKICFNGSLSLLSKSSILQLAILTANVASFRAFMRQINIMPHYLAGHSLGEYAALSCTGAISFADTLKIVRYRGVLTEEVIAKNTGSMAIIEKIDIKIAESLCKDISKPGNSIYVSCYNSPTQCAVSGNNETVELVSGRLIKLNAAVTPLIVSAPFHCPLMLPAAIELESELKKYSFGQFLYPVISNVNGLPYREPDKVKDTLVSQMIKPVQWQETINYFKRFGITHTIEMGPKNLLSRLVNENVSDIETFNFAHREDRNIIRDLFNSSKDYIDDKTTVIDKCIAATVATRDYSGNEAEIEHIRNIVEPYKRLLIIRDKLAENNNNPTSDQVKESLLLLSSIFKAKMVPYKEKTEWINGIFEESGEFYFGEFVEYCY